MNVFEGAFVVKVFGVLALALSVGRDVVVTHIIQSNIIKSCRNLPLSISVFLIVTFESWMRI